jgi:hypothetical protein
MTVYDIADADPQIPSDGSREVSADINAWLAGLPNGTADEPTDVAFGKFGTYWTDDTIEPTGKVHWVIHGKGSTFIRKLKGGLKKAEHWKFNHCAYFDVNHVFVAGAASPRSGYDPRFEAQHAFSVASCKSMTFTDCRSNGVWGDQWYLCSDGPGDSWSEGIAIANCSGGYTHRHGVSIVAARNVDVMDCDWGRVARTWLDLEPNGPQGGAQAVYVGRSTGRYKLNWMAAFGQRGGDISDITLRDNWSTGRALFVAVALGPDQLGTRSNFTVTGNRSDTADGNNNGAIMVFRDVEGFVTVTDNVQPLNRGRVTGLPNRVARFYCPPETTITYEGNGPDVG